MPSNAATRREQLLKALIDAAEATIADQGLAALKARDLARQIGCALGAIYNLVADMDELVLRVGSRTLQRLDAALAGAAAGRALSSAAAATDRLVAIALAYCRFAAGNKNLWRTLFEHQMSSGEPPPAWVVEEEIRLFEHAVAPLRVLAPELDEKRLDILARTLFAAVHGVALLGIEERMIAVPSAALEEAITQLVRLTCAGLMTVLQDKTSAREF
jgi:AcrR family transcriptional regulator